MPIPFSPTFHRDATRARWAEDEARFGPGFIARHAKLYEADMRVALTHDANANSNRQAEADLRACGGNKEDALAMAFARIDAALTAGVDMSRRAAA